MMARHLARGLDNPGAGDFGNDANLSEKELPYADLSPEWRNDLLDPAGWNKVLQPFAATLRLAVALVDPEGRLLGTCHNSQPVWRFVRAARPESGGCPFCLAPSTFCNAVSDAVRTGGVVTVEDQAGLAHVAVPLTLEGRQLGALIAGQVFSRYPEPLRLQRVAREAGISQQQLWHEAVQQTPLSRATLQLYANLLQSLGEAFLGQRHAALLQKKLAQTGQRYRFFLESAKDYALYTIDPTGRVTSWNPGAERLFGYTEPEIVGRNASILYSTAEGDREELTRAMLEADRSGSVEWEGCRLRKDGTRFLGSGVLASMGDADNREYGRLVRDVTELRRSEEDLRQAQKLEGIGVLAGGIAHDFNNLLTGIMGGLSFAKSSLPPDDPAYPMVEMAEQSSTRAAELVAQLLAYAGKGKFIVSRFDICTLISEMLALIGAGIPKNVELRLSLTPGLPWIEADASQIRQIVMNLIVNAAEAIGAEGGIVQVSAGTSDSGEYVFLEVKDSGSGMNEATRSRMFDPFFTTKFTGRGLGLAAVSGIVRGHKGKMQVESSPGEGTSFTVSFPAVQSGVLRLLDPPSAAVSRDTGTILIVDDEPMLRKMAGVILEKSGFSVLFAKDGREAVEIFREHASEIAAVLLDMTMPVMGGHQALQLIREIQPDVAIILSSGYAEAFARKEIGYDTVAGFVQKPYTAARLIASIRQSLGHELLP
jgi:PAS domain S-box-containing protein